MSCPPIFRVRIPDKNNAPKLRGSSRLPTTSLLSHPPNEPPDENAIIDDTDNDWESDNSSGHEDNNLERRTDTEDFAFKRLPKAIIIRTTSNLSQLLAEENKEAKASPLSRSMPDMCQHASCTRFLSEHRILRPPPAEISTSLDLPTSYTATARPLSPRSTRANILATELTEELRRGLLWERCQNKPTPSGYGSRGSPLCKKREWHLDDTLHYLNHRVW
ncbi:hypothetical protein F4824DRAFT_514572 [Ustulina deusta]|nr:hypothetical protein F4824DRAFT_514572 [Ustulina deusta]